MSKPYPSRRELRLQRERAERARLREAELQRWTDEVEQRDKPLKAIPTPESAPVEDATTTDAPTPAPATENGNQPVQDADDDAAPAVSTSAASRRRRADSQVTSTGMLPIISKPVEQPKPQSRREMRELETRRAAQRQAELKRLQRQQAESEGSSRRRANAPQTTPPPAPAVPELAVDTSPAQQADSPSDEDVFDVEITGMHLSATEITDTGGLDTIEIRRAELRAETERLTQEIIELGASNPNVIDSKLLRRQKELAEKSQELQHLETAAIELVESENEDAVESPDTTADATAEESQESDTTRQATPEQDAETPNAESSEDVKPNRGRRRRQSTQGTFVTGPFEVAEDDDTTASTPARETKKPPLAEFIQAPTEPERDPRDPLEASSAHGLDTLDARDVEAPDRILRMSAVIMFAIGMIALIVAIILLAR